MRLFRRTSVLIALFCLAASLCAADPKDPLPSWNDTATKKALLSFVKDVTDPKSPKYVKPEDRIAMFDNDGTLWVEQPMYPQIMFALDRAQAMIAKKPELKDSPPFKILAAGDRAFLGSFDAHHEADKLIAATHAGMTQDEFDRIAKDWLSTARQSRFKHLYKECVYQPQLELLAYLRANGFKTWMCSGGGVDFLRCFAEGTYGIVPEQVIGTDLLKKYELRDGKPVFVRTPDLVPPAINYAGKPVGILRDSGRKPILAFGNSDGDQQMLEYTDSGDGPRLMLLLHHDDAEREYAYDRNSKVGTLDKAWDEARKRGWIVVSMKDDFRVMFPFDKK